MAMETAGADRRYRFFAGKGGVGKTTCAAAAALAAAESGGRVLVASTDPAHSLGDALGRRLGPDPRPIPVSSKRRKGDPGCLWAVELSGERAFARWLGPRRAALRKAALRGTYLDEEDVDRLLALSPPGVDEIAGLLDLERAARETGCSEVVVDTAPTAHTLRLLATPEVLARIANHLDDLQDRHRQLARRFGVYRPDRVDATLREIEAEGEGLAALLADPRRARFVWLLLPESLSLAEARDGVGILTAAGLEVAEIVVNRVTPPGDLCPPCGERRREELRVLAELPAAFPGRALRYLPALGAEPRGPGALRRVARCLADPGAGRDLLEEPAAPPARRAKGRPRASSPPEWPDLLAPPEARLLFFGGKGGVGKTTCAAAAALVLAGGRPHQRLLALSTDPAHSLGDVFDARLSDRARRLPGGPPNLWARELDASGALDRWSAGRRETIEGLLDAFLGAALEEAEGPGAEEEGFSGITPGGLDELMAVTTLATAVFGEGEEAYDLVVVDLAPTGHALRLLEMPALALAWDRALLAILLKYREVLRPGPLAAELVELSRSLTRLAELLIDPRRTHFVPVARAAALPRRETARLISALGRLGIGTAALVINAVPPAPGEFCVACGDPSGAEARELRRLAALGKGLGKGRGKGRSAILIAPAWYPPPQGVRELADWGRSWRGSAS